MEHFKNTRYAIAIFENIGCIRRRRHLAKQVASRRIVQTVAELFEIRATRSDRIEKKFLIFTFVFASRRFITNCHSPPFHRFIHLVKWLYFCSTLVTLSKKELENVSISAQIENNSLIGPDILAKKCANKRRSHLTFASNFERSYESLSSSIPSSIS